MNMYERDFHSFTSMSTYIRCGLQYEFRYGQGIKTPPAVAVIEGSAGHKGQELNYKQKIESRIDLPIGDVLDAVSTTFDDRAGEVEDWEDQKPGDAKDEIINVMRVVHKEHFPIIQPVEVEEERFFDVGSQPFKVYRDLKDENGWVRDTKFTKRAKSQGDADNDLQLTVGSYLDKTEKVCFDCMVKSKKPRVAVIPSHRGPEHWAKLESRVPKILDAISKGIFLPADPTSWACSKKFCGYWNICEQGAKYKATVIVDVGAAPKWGDVAI